MAVIGPAFSAILADARGGDEEAFACLFRAIQPVLLRYLRVIAPEAAEDVAGETWLQVVAGLAGFRGGEDAFRAWLFAIARHRAIDAGRARARRHIIPLDQHESEERLTARGINTSLAMLVADALHAYLKGNKKEAAEDLSTAAEEIASRLNKAEKG